MSNVIVYYVHKLFCTLWLLLYVIIIIIIIIIVIDTVYYIIINQFELYKLFMNSPYELASCNIILTLFNNYLTTPRSKFHF